MVSRLKRKAGILAPVSQKRVIKPSGTETLKIRKSFSSEDGASTTGSMR